ncbi:MAG: hypothetical protein ACRDTG_32925 [Pseudonocardiaceae bacterium]
MTAAISDASFGTSRVIGRYFGIVSAVPTGLLAAYLFLLIASGAWTHRPDFQAGVDALTSASIGKIVGLLGVILVIALVMHTVQFALVQFLEGYWGGNRVMRFLRTRRILYHLTRLHEAHALYERAYDALAVNGQPQVSPADSVTPEARIYVAALTDCADALKVIDTYPDKPENIMPTRLGNLLRRYEDNAGRGYNIKILQKATHLALVAPENHVNYLNDQRNGLDLAVRLCASGIIASLATAFLMWPWDVWLLLAAVPYALAYISYRGALVAAGHYGDALGALVDLNRFRMYEALHLRLPDNTIAERTQNDLMTQVIENAEIKSERVSIVYEHPITPSAEIQMVPGVAEQAKERPSD